MAKAPPPKASGTSRIRFIMVDAEISDSGDLTQVTQAIQNALRPPAAAGRLSAPAPVRTNGGTAATSPSPLVVDAQEEEAGEQEPSPEVAEPVRAQASDTVRAPRKIKPPEVMELDLTSEPAFAQFAGEKKPSTHLTRFLTVAAWFKEHRQVDAVTMNHVYTCYRHMKWPSDLQDFSQPLRDLKRQQLVGSKERGHYAINHLGLQQVEDLGKS